MLSASHSVLWGGLSSLAFEGIFCLLFFYCWVQPLCLRPVPCSGLSGHWCLNLHCSCFWSSMPPVIYSIFSLEFLLFLGKKAFFLFTLETYGLKFLFFMTFLLLLPGSSNAHTWVCRGQNLPKFSMSLSWCDIQVLQMHLSAYCYRILRRNTNNAVTNILLQCYNRGK